MTTWMLVDAEMAAQVRAALIYVQGQEEKRCGESGCMCDIYYEDGNTARCGVATANLIHRFDTSLHTTDTVPADFAAERRQGAARTGEEG